MRRNLRARVSRGSHHAQGEGKENADSCCGDNFDRWRGVCSLDAVYGAHPPSMPYTINEDADQWQALPSPRSAGDCLYLDAEALSPHHFGMKAQNWPVDWQAIDNPVSRSSFEAELARELPADHVLSGRIVTALARRLDRDDFLFRLDDGSFAQVHLTWSVEADPRWPGTEMYSSFGDWERSVAADQVWISDDE